MPARKTRTASLAANAAATPEEQRLIVSDLMRKAELEVMFPTNRSPFDFIGITTEGVGTAVRCGAAARAGTRTQFHKFLSDAVTKLPEGTGELWLVDTAFTPPTLEVASQYKRVQVWELSEIVRYYAPGDREASTVSVTALRNAVRDLIRHRGFQVLVSMELHDRGPLDLSFATADGNQIGVYCLTASRLRNHLEIREWLSELSASRRDVREVLVVGTRFSEAQRVLLKPHKLLRLVELIELPAQLQQYKQAQPRPRPATSKAAAKAVRSKVKANKQSILLAVTALLESIDDKLENLKLRKPNSEESIAAWETTISDYQALRARTAELEEAVRGLSSKAETQTKAVARANTFGATMSTWLAKDGQAVITAAGKTGVFCLGALVCTMMGVSPEVAVAATAWVVAGKKPKIPK